jgi:hypothetical protein
MRVKVVIRESSYQLFSVAEQQKANAFAQNMQSFASGVLGYLKATFSDDEMKVRPRVHYVWNKVRRESWAYKITMAWALYTISDVIRLYSYYPKSDVFEFPLDYGWVLSTKTLRVAEHSRTMRVVMPKGSVQLDGFYPFWHSDVWLGSGRVSVHKDRLLFSLEVIGESVES